MGLIFARELAAIGIDIIMVSNQEKELEEAAARLSEEYGIKTYPLVQDLAEQDAAEKMYAWCREHSLEPDILINNAGMFFFTELDQADLHKVNNMLNLHNLCVAKSCVLFGADMKKRRKGYILIVSSMAAKLPCPGISTYSATKAFLKTFGKCLSFELRPHNVGITTVCPAAIATPLYRLKPSLMKFGVRTGFINTPQWLVRKALRGMQNKRRIMRPGLMNVWLPPLIAVMPGRVEEKLWEVLREKLA